MDRPSSTSHCLSTLPCFPLPLPLPAHHPAARPARPGPVSWAVLLFLPISAAPGQPSCHTISQLLPVTALWLTPGSEQTPAKSQPWWELTRVQGPLARGLRDSRVGT